MRLSKGFLLTLAATLCWSVGIILIRFMLKRGENPYNIALWSLLFASPYWLYIFSKNFKKTRSLGKKDLGLLLLLGLDSGLAVNLTEILALNYSSAINFSFLNRTVIIFTMIFAFIFLKERINLKKIILALLILVGSYFLITKGQNLSLSLGDVFTLTEAALIAFSAILVKSLVSSAGPDISASTSFLIGVIPTALIAQYYHVIAIPKMLPLVIVSGILYNILINYFRFRALQVASATYVTMIFSFTPVFVSLLAMPILGETLLPIQITGGFLILLAGIFVEKLKI